MPVPANREVAHARRKNPIGDEQCKQERPRLAVAPGSELEPLLDSE